jgi:hypothetical protein
LPDGDGTMVDTGKREECEMLKRTCAAALLIASLAPASPAGPQRDTPGGYSRWAYLTPTL